jgi:hypothetical protein
MVNSLEGQLHQKHAAERSDSEDIGLINDEISLRQRCSKIRLKMDFSVAFLVPSTAGQVVKSAAEQGLGMLYLLAVQVDAFVALECLADTLKSSKMEFNSDFSKSAIKTAFNSARTMTTVRLPHL